MPRPGTRVFIGGRAVAVAQVQVRQSVAHPAGHVQRVGARRRGVREVQRVVRVVAVQRVVTTGRTPRRRRPVVRRGVASVIRSRAAPSRRNGRHGMENVLHRHHDVAALFERGDLITEPVGVATLPAEGRMNRRSAHRPFGGCTLRSKQAPGPNPTPAGRSVGTARAPRAPASRSAATSANRPDVLADRFGHHQSTPS